MKQYPARINAVLALGATTTAPYYNVEIGQTLCVATCVDEVPVFTPQFTVVGIETVGENQYVIDIHVEGAITYTPCGCGCCQTRVQRLSENFSLPVYSTTAITAVSIAAGATANAMVKSPCRDCSSEMVSSTPITLTITTA